MPLFRFSKGQLQDNYNIVDNRIVVDSGRSIGDYAKGRELASHLESYVNSWAFEPEQVQKLSLWGTPWVVFGEREEHYKRPFDIDILGPRLALRRLLSSLWGFDRKANSCGFQ